MIVLVRHGHALGGKGHCIGRTDIPLSEQGREQARVLADSFGVADFQAVWSSPLSRAWDTAAPVCERLGLACREHEGLSEIDMGDWDGCAFADIRARYSAEYEARGQDFAGFRISGGESFFQVQQRALVACRELAAGPRPCLGVTHAGVLRTLLCHFHELPLNDLFRFSPAHGECVVLTGTADELHLEAEGVSCDECVRMVESRR